MQQLQMLVMDGLGVRLMTQLLVQQLKFMVEMVVLLLEMVLMVFIYGAHN